MLLLIYFLILKIFVDFFKGLLHFVRKDRLQRKAGPNMKKEQTLFAP